MVQKVKQGTAFLAVVIACFCCATSAFADDDSVYYDDSGSSSIVEEVVVSEIETPVETSSSSDVVPSDSVDVSQDMGDILEDDSSSSEVQGDTIITVVLPTSEPDQTFFEKPFDQYSTTESLLFLIFCLVLSCIVLKAYEKFKM